MKLKIEGKLRDGFFEWLAINSKMVDIGRNKYNIAYLFYDLPQSAQFGLLQEYADTLGYYIIIDVINWIIHDDDFPKILADGSETSRPEAQTAAISKLNEIINK